MVWYDIAIGGTKRGLGPPLITRTWLRTERLGLLRMGRWKPVIHNKLKRIPFMISFGESDTHYYDSN